MEFEQTAKLVFDNPAADEDEDSNVLDIDLSQAVFLTEFNGRCVYAVSINPQLIIYDKADVKADYS